MKGRATLVALAIATLCGSVAAFAQRVDPASPTTFVVGPPRGNPRADAARRGQAASLPSSPRVVWRKTLERATPMAPLARHDGGLVALSTAGELIELDELGVEKARVNLTLATQRTDGREPETPVAAALLSDDAVLVATSFRTLYVVRDGAVRARARVADDRNAAASASASARAEPEQASAVGLDDGGAVVAFDTELVLVDRDASVRARAVLPGPLGGPLVTGDGVVYAVLQSGSIATWRPGGEVRRVGRFGGPVTGRALPLGRGILAAVVEGQVLERFDTARQTGGAVFASTTMWMGPATLAQGGLAMLGWQAGRVYALEMDLEGRERRRTAVATGAGTDAGAPSGALGEVLVDREGRIAFVAPEGIGGVVERDGTVRTLGESVCPKGARRTGTSGPAGLVATKKGFVIACENGLLMAIE